MEDQDICQLFPVGQDCLEVSTKTVKRLELEASPSSSVFTALHKVENSGAISAYNLQR